MCARQLLHPSVQKRAVDALSAWLDKENSSTVPLLAPSQAIIVIILYGK